jgi:DNA-directed RNA polymerase subunit RPC12/RpoP
MGILERLINSRGDEDEEDVEDEVGYWCVACGMLVKRSASDIDYSWCTRCGATSVWKLPWNGTSESAENESMGAPVAHNTGPRAGESDDPRRA